MDDSFLPSGAIESRDRGSPKKYMGATASPQMFNGPPISPPKTRSGSAENTSASLVEDWRAYTKKLRSQHEGERAHMLADRARMEEVMVEERILWDKEREIMKARIAELETQLLTRGGSAVSSPPALHPPASISRQHRASVTSPGSISGSITSSVDSSSRSVPQESGRNADGSPFYAPAPRNPSRTFDPSMTSDLRVDSITAPRETPIRVTSKELNSSNFGLQSPPSDLESIPETTATTNIPESIDISYIQPSLDGVPIKASAVSPTFAAKVLSPQYSPSSAHLSPSTKPPCRDAGSPLSLSPLSRSQCPTNHKLAALELVIAPENRRLTMHAGHTPNHSMTKFDLLGSENATPTQARHADHLAEQTAVDDRDEVHSLADGEHNVDDSEDGDRELTGQLGMTNDPVRDDAFLAQLVEKLQAAQRTEGMSPGSEASSSASEGGSKFLSNTRGQRRFGDEDYDEGEEKEDEGPPLRLKPSINFGRPMGRI